ncbi:ATP-dependent DNA helicase RecQ [Thiospirochaeta perfilievii]|uniref:DNA 3'-5' helicase n=1 Tax=Thiospirochaeta perfilievii TaxID=252967 RepID=A0A5C1QAI4_9SPIO|nr:helicase-related protein [Thiospirochaeta perfilievii]QEN03674.1 ATP-dependent DNA helicase RecQ [Thiospirochaeta perfilievii]
MEDLINSKSKELFGINYVFPFQRLVISNTLAAAGYFSEDDRLESIPRQIVLLPTGAGKSLCFMLPGVLLEGMTLIIFPLLSLMADQERRIIEGGGSVTILKGGMSKDEKDEAYKLIRTNSVKFILTNPETLGSVKILDLLSGAEITHVVIDETHTVSQWGESFRPTYLEVGKHIKTIGVDLVTAYTATASEYILESVIKHIFLGEQVNIVRGNPDRTNIHYSVIPSISKDETLIELVKSVETPAIIFHSSRVSAEVTNRLLINRLERDDIVYYHAGLTKDQKSRIEEWFFTSDTGILNATCAYGMGVDKQNIRSVIHLEVPSSIEAFLQESGRGGRDRKLAKSFLITTRVNKKSRILDAINTGLCRREVLLRLMGHEIEFCSGCDICDNSFQAVETGFIQITQFLIKNRFIYNIDQSVNILKGFYTFTAKQEQYHNACGFGILSRWDKDSIKDSINILTKSNVIIKRWGKLGLTKHLIIGDETSPSPNTL